MKRSTLLIIGGIIIILLLVAWVYILFFNNNTGEGDAYTDLTFGDTTDTTYIPPDTTSDTTSVVDVTGTEQLRQLTTTPVAGFQEVIVDKEPDRLVYWAELGTGQIHAINLTNGEEERVSATTIPLTKHVALTTDGKYMMLQSGFGANTETAIYTINSSSTSVTKTTSIPGDIDSFTVSSDNTFLFAEKTNSSLIAKQFNPVTKKTTTLFTTPFREAMIVWGDTASDTHYFYPKPSSRLEGFFYLIQNGTLQRLPIDGYGLSGFGNKTSVIYNKRVDETYRSYIYTTENAVTESFPFPIIQEKCANMHDATGYICATSVSAQKGDTLDMWYKGLTVYTDDLWSIDPLNTAANFLLDVKKESGRGLDIINPLLTPDDNHLYFQNKSDQTLWLFTQNLDTNQ